jgi:hypothetical protein
MELLMSDIFATNPYGQPVKRTSLLDGFNQGADTVFNLYDKKYKNQQEAAKAQYAQSTLDDSIAAANAKNQADIQYYPQQQQFKTQQEMFKVQQEEQTVKEIMARTGLSYAQAREVAARTSLVDTQKQALTDPTMMFESLYKKLQTLPQGSPERAYVTSALNSMLNGGAGMPAMGGTGSKKTAAGGMFAPMGGQGNMIVNPLETSRAGFRQAATVDADGNPITMESPTAASGTRNQLRGESEAESKYISPLINKGINNYQSFSPTTSLLIDSWLARGKDKQAEAAQQRLLDYSTASRLVAESAAINARQSSGQAPGIELLRHFESKMFPGLPMDFANRFIPSDIKVKATNAYPAVQQSLTEQAINQERTGYPQQGAPDWASPPNPYPNGMIDASGNYVPPQQAAPQQQQPQVNAAQLQAMAQEAIAKGADRAAVQARLKQILGGAGG